MGRTSVYNWYLHSESNADYMKMKPLLVLVEDSPTQAKIISDFLKDCGARVIVADDGPEGIQAVIDHYPHAVILDVKLPTMNGFQVVRRLKRNRVSAKIPVIMLTQLEQDQNRMNGLNNGADYFIVKDTDFAKELWRTLVALDILSW